MRIRNLDMVNIVFFCSVLIVYVVLSYGFHMPEEIERTLPVEPYSSRPMQFESVSESNRYLSSYMDFTDKYPQYEYLFSDENSELFYVSYDKPIVDYEVGKTYMITVDYLGNPVLSKCPFPEYKD